MKSPLNEIEKVRARIKAWHEQIEGNHRKIKLASQWIFEQEFTFAEALRHVKSDIAKPAPKRRKK